MGIAEKDLLIAGELKDRVLQVEGVRVRRIILFGSRARGNARPDSDFDLLVVLHGVTQEELTASRHSLYGTLGGTGVSVEPWVMSDVEFEETKGVIGGLAYPASREGVVLYENP